MPSEQNYLCHKSMIHTRALDRHQCIPDRTRVKKLFGVSHYHARTYHSSTTCEDHGRTVEKDRTKQIQEEKKIGMKQ